VAVLFPVAALLRALPNMQTQRSGEMPPSAGLIYAKLEQMLLCFDRRSLDMNGIVEILAQKQVPIIKCRLWKLLIS